MTPELGLLWEVSFVEFIIVTLAMGGGGAWMIGRSTALTWNGWGILVFYVVLLTIAVRFIHFSLFQGSFFLPLETLETALYYAGVDFVLLMIVASAGRQFVRSRQMQRQYGFLRGAPEAAS